MQFDRGVGNPAESHGDISWLEEEVEVLWGGCKRFLVPIKDVLQVKTTIEIVKHVLIITPHREVSQTVIRRVVFLPSFIIRNDGKNTAGAKFSRFALQRTRSQAPQNGDEPKGEKIKIRDGVQPYLK